MSSGEERTAETFSWTIDNEVHLYEAMIGFKPAGVNKHFNMMTICERLSAAVNKEVTSDVVWKYLETLYNLDMIDDIEGLPFPNEEKDFSLPETDYGTLMKQKIKEIAIKIEEVDDRSVSPRVPSSRSQSRAGNTKETPAKSSKKEPEKTPKSQNNKDVSNAVSSNTTESTTPIKAAEKETGKNDPRRDSKDSNSSSKESTKTSSASIKTPAKETKSTKPSRSSVLVSEKQDDSSKTPDDKRGNKRSTRGSLKPEEPTPPVRRRRI